MARQPGWNYEYRDRIVRLLEGSMKRNKKEERMAFLSVRMVLLVLLTSTEVQSRFHDIQIQHDVEYTSKSNIRKIENLKHMLEYIRNSKEFQPFRVSLLMFSTQSSILESLLHRIAIGNIQGYRITASEFVSKCTWKDEGSLTWILPIDDLHDLLAFVYLQEELWKPNNQYLIVFAGKTRTLKTWGKILQQLWRKYNVYRILVATITDDFRCFLGYRPFDIVGEDFGQVHKSCINDVEDTKNSEKYDATRTKDSTNNPVTSFLSRNVSLFEKFENVNGYPIKVTVFPSLMMYIDVDENNKTVHYTKLDAKVMNVLERGMHANFDIQVFYKTRNEDPFHHSLKSINDHESEMIITSFFVKSYDDFSLYEFTVGIAVDKLCFIAPTRGYLPKSYMPFMPFSKHIWLILAVYNFLATTFWVILKYLSNTFRTNKPISRPLAKTHEIPRKKLAFDDTLSSNKKANTHSLKRNVRPVEIHPYVIACTELLLLLCYPFERAYTTAQRVFLCSALFFGLVIGGLYHSCLVSTLSKPVSYPEIKTIEDVANSNYTIITKYENLKSSTFIEDDLLDIKLKNKIRVLHSEKPTNYFVAYDRSVIALGRFASVKLENDSVYYDNDGNKLTHIVEECPATYTLSYVVRLHSPYIERINTLLLRMQQFGLVKLWYQEMMNPLQIEEEKRKVATSERKAKLSLEHYSLTFLGLFLGLIGCFLVFLGEIYHARWGRR